MPTVSLTMLGSPGEASVPSGARPPLTGTRLPRETPELSQGPFPQARRENISLGPRVLTSFQGLSEGVPLMHPAAVSPHTPGFPRVPRLVGHTRSPTHPYP